MSSRANEESSSLIPGSNTETTPSKDIKESIAALRSILMIDTPTKSLLSSKHPTIAAQQSLYDVDKRNMWDELANLRSKTSDLRTKLQAATDKAEQETRKHKTLQDTYDALTKHRKELSLQLDSVTKSRELAEQKLDEIRKILNEERESMMSERVQWRPQLENLTAENEKIASRNKELELQRTAADLQIEQLQIRISEAETSLKTTQAELQQSQDLLSKEVAKQNSATATREKLLSLQSEIAATKKRHQNSLGSMLQIQQTLKNQLQEAQSARQTAEGKITELLADLKRLEKVKEGAESEKLKAAEDAIMELEAKLAAQNEKLRAMVEEARLLAEQVESAKLKAVEDTKREMQASLAAVNEKMRVQKLRYEEQINSLKRDLETARFDQKKSEIKLKSVLKELEDAEASRERVEKDFAELQVVLQCQKKAGVEAEAELNDLKNQRREAKPLFLSNLSGLVADTDGLPSSLVSAINLLQDLSDGAADEGSSNLTRRLVKEMQEIKVEFRSIQSSKKKAESKFVSATTTGDNLRYELASAREELREIRDHLLDSQSEANQLNAEVVRLQEELEHQSRSKRTVDDCYIASEEDDEEQTHGSSMKRQRRHDQDGMSDQEVV